MTNSLVSPINVNCTDIPGIPELQFTDNCSSIVTVAFSSSMTTIDINGNYTITRTWVASDECSNSQSFEQIINVSTSNTALTLTTEDFCTDDNGETAVLMNYVLNQYPSTPINGVWEDTDNTGALQNGVFDPYQIPIGNYNFTYVYGDQNCPQRIIVTVPVNNDCIIAPCRDIIIHNAFSPNGDGTNEIFLIEYIGDTCYSEVSLEIFNRWGLKVYSAEGSEVHKSPFTGTSQGRATLNTNEQLPSGVYFYILKYRTSEGNYISKESYLYLNR